MLTVLLPVHDAQSSLATVVHQALELASDVSVRFELLIVDDGSSDATSEVAEDLRRDYPQVRLVRHRTPQGREAAIRTGLAHARGEVILLGDSVNGQSVANMQQCWRLAAAAPQLSLRRDGAAPPRHTASRPGRPNFQMARTAPSAW